MDSISNHKKRQKQVTELLQYILDNTPIILWAIDKDGIFTLQEGAGLKAFGLVPGQRIGQSIFDVNQDIPDTAPYVKRALAGESLSVEFKMRGNYFQHRAIPTRDTNGNITGVVGVSLDITRTHQVENELMETRSRAALLQQIGKMGFWEWDINEDRVFWSENVGPIFGIDNQDFDGDYNAYLNATHPEDKQALTEKLSATVKSGSDFEVEHRILWPDQSTRWVYCSGNVLRDTSGKALRMTGFVLDVTEKHIANEEMKKLSRALEQTADSVMIVNNKGIIEYINKAFEKMSGFSQEELIGNKPSILKSGMHNTDFYHQLWATLLKGKIYNNIITNRKKDGTLYDEERTITPLTDENNKITHFVATGRDITERKQIHERLQYLAHHDVLTGLPNRTLFIERMDYTLKRCARESGKIALLFLDIDHFKNINDTLGHEVGDLLLKQLALRLQETLRECDLIARIGGDEFLILLDNISSIDDITYIAKKILTVFSSAFRIEERELFVTTSIGISVSPTDGSDTQTLLKNADIAMYRSKEQGRNTFQFYSADMSSRALQRLSLETSLRYALENDEFTLYYQPQLSLHTHKIIGVEALLRWQHPEIGMVSPLDFIPLLEETGLIKPVGEWIIKTACHQARQWHIDFDNSLKVAINISNHQINSGELKNTLEKILKETEVDSTMIELEITESAIMEDTPLTRSVFNAIDKMGFQIALDDFGTGYSSLSYLQRYPFDTIKIDRSFIRDITSNDDDAAITKAIIAMANNLNLAVVAEGIETEEQLQFLEESRCDVIQGFHVGRPVPAEEITLLFNRLQQNSFPDPVP